MAGQGRHGRHGRAEAGRQVSGIPSSSMVEEPQPVRRQEVNRLAGRQAGAPHSEAGGRQRHVNYSIGSSGAWGDFVRAGRNGWQASRHGHGLAP